MPWTRNFVPSGGTKSLNNDFQTWTPAFAATLYFVRTGSYRRKPRATPTSICSRAVSKSSCWRVDHSRQTGSSRGGEDQGVPRCATGDLDVRLCVIED